MSDRGQDVSDELVVIRTILSRAQTGMREIVEDSYRGNVMRPRKRYNPHTQRWDIVGHDAPTGRAPDPDSEAMYYALERVVHELSRWRRTRVYSRENKP